MHLYAGFIDLFVQTEAAPARSRDADGAHWNHWVTPDRSAAEAHNLPQHTLDYLRNAGFTTALLVPDHGVFAGRTALVSLADPVSPASSKADRLYAADLHHTLRFQTSGWGDRHYPTSHPGAVALMRQTFIDADYQRDHAPAAAPNALTPLEDRDVPLLFDTDHELEALLADDIAREARRPALIVGSGAEFRRLDALAAADRPVVLPLRFPRKPDVSSPAAAEAIELDELMTWEQAPTNPRRLHDAGLLVSLTASHPGRPASFHERLREAIDAGLDHDAALAMLTTNPARVLAELTPRADLASPGKRLGRIAQGHRANLVLADGPIFDEHTNIIDLYIDGRRHPINPADEPDLAGPWRLVVGDPDAPSFEMLFNLGASPKDRHTIQLIQDDAANRARDVKLDGRRLSFLVDDPDDGSGAYIMSGVLQPNRTIRGIGLDQQDDHFEWLATPIDQSAFDAALQNATPHNQPDDDNDANAERSTDADPSDVPDLPGYPFGPYALAPGELDAQPTVTLITNATIWTQSDRGVLDDAWLLVDGNTIASLGTGEPPAVPDHARRIDARGKHLTPGLIDAHSHTGLFRFGVNEAGQAVTAEVRIADSIDPDFVSWYRQLAAGVTTVLSLHGSANPIGGQSQTHKVRWGAEHPHDMRLQTAKPGIKFALGENVKQSNWNLSDSERTRYPQTRMGVEAIMRDRFAAARDYMNAHAQANRAGATPPPRDLELEALAEVLRGERLVHCHSYRQDEILMLCRIAEDFGFTIGTFQHGLEVYKVAEAVREHAIGASLFSDWWMFKVEVMDAIPYAGPLQTEAGVLTSYNSDSDELARRMNLEAAKALKYAHRDEQGVPVLSEQDALAFVTNNAAVQLGVDHRVGSLKPGMDADLVLWSDHPLSTLALVERTFVDGRELFSLKRDAQHREHIARERRRLIDKIIAAPDKPRDHTDDEESPAGELSPEQAALAAWYRAELAAGRDPEAAAGGDCGCALIDHKRHALDKHAEHTHDH